jgi:hypothetical protein
MKMRLVWMFVAVVLNAGWGFGQTATKDSAQNPGFPRVVARLNLRGRTDGVGPSTLYTPKTSTLLRVSVNMVCTIGNGLSEANWIGKLSYENEIGQNITLFSVGCSLPLANPGTWIFSASKGNPITFATEPQGDTSGTQYNAYVVLEQLE